MRNFWIRNETSKIVLSKETLQRGLDQKRNTQDRPKLENQNSKVLSKSVWSKKVAKLSQVKHQNMKVQSKNSWINKVTSKIVQSKES